VKARETLRGEVAALAVKGAEQILKRSRSRGPRRSAEPTETEL
jgi:F0F1-type ATP synthase membrane subunit b/b'